MITLRIRGCYHEVNYFRSILAGCRGTWRACVNEARGVRKIYLRDDRWFGGLVVEVIARIVIRVR